MSPTVGGLFQLGILRHVAKHSYILVVVFYSGSVPGRYQVRNMFVTGSTPQADHQRTESFFRFCDFRLIYFSVCTYCRRYLFNVNWLTLRFFNFFEPFEF